MHALQSILSRSENILSSGQSLCSKASTLSSENIQTAIEVMAMEASVKWGVEVLHEQLNMAVSMARGIVVQRSLIVEDAKSWDILKSERMKSMDAVLENLGSQPVPPSLHLLSSGSSLFGSQHSLLDPSAAPSNTHLTIATGQGAKSSWKTLRDFVDEKSIEDALEGMEDDRARFDTALSGASTQPQAINRRVAELKLLIPNVTSLDPSLISEIGRQEEAASEMANCLERLTAHFDAVNAVIITTSPDSVSNDAATQSLEHDTDSASAIVAQLQEGFSIIQNVKNALQDAATTMQKHTSAIDNLIPDVEQLEENIQHMFSSHQTFQDIATGIKSSLQWRHDSIKELEDSYHTYQLAYDHLILEVDRRKRDQNAVQAHVEEWTKVLSSLREEEVEARSKFLDTHGTFLPEDLCPFLPEQPLKYVIERDGSESAVSLSSSTVLEAMQNLGITETDFDQ